MHTRYRQLGIVPGGRNRNDDSAEWRQFSPRGTSLDRWQPFYSGGDRLPTPCPTAFSQGIGIEVVSGGNATISQCAIIGFVGSAAGPGLYLSNLSGTAVVQGCSISTNSPGGGFFISSGSVTLTRNLVAGNVSSTAGAGQLVAGPTGTVLFSGNTLVGNQSTGAAVGGVAISGGSTTVSANQFLNNANGMGSVASGGGVFSDAPTQNFFGNTFIGNAGSSGGAIDSAGSSVNISSNQFLQNVALQGGAVFVAGAQSLLLSGNTLSGNMAHSGGGAYLTGGDMSVTGNSFLTNGAAHCSGGGAYVQSTGRVQMLANIFQGNLSTGPGGGFYGRAGRCEFSDNLVANNSQTANASSGAGTWIDVSSTLVYVNNTVAGNSSSGGVGGAHFQVDGTVETLNVWNNIFWGNTTEGGGADVFVSGSGFLKSFQNNDADSVTGTWDVQTNNLDIDPSFFAPTQGDYHIRSGSPAIDAGSIGIGLLPALDLDSGPRQVGAAVDLGAFEFSTAATHPADVNGDWVISASEYMAYQAAWNVRTNGSSSSISPSSDSVSRAGYLSALGGVYHNDGSAKPTCWKSGP